jgi:long-chain acyl-CoA synthetase
VLNAYARAEEQVFSKIRAKVGFERCAWYMIGAAPTSLEVLEFFAAIGIPICEVWGMSETASVATLVPRDRLRLGTVGPPIPGVEVRLADDGEVLVRLEGRWLATGDVGRLDEDGHLFLLDRKKDVILRGGYSVYPREVEEALAAHPGVREGVVVGVPHATLGEEVAALVVPAPGCDPEDVKAFVRERVAAYAYPRLVVLVDELPHGPTGKVQRREIDRDALARLLERDW